MPRKPQDTFEDRDTVEPVIRELRRRLRTEGKTMKQIADYTGINYWTVSRALNLAVASPRWTDLTALILKAGLTPDEAARIAGYDVPAPKGAAEPLAPEDRELLDLVHAPGLSETARKNITALTRTLVESDVREHQQQPRQSPPSRPTRKRATG